MHSNRVVTTTVASLSVSHKVSTSFTIIYRGLYVRVIVLKFLYRYGTARYRSDQKWQRRMKLSFIYTRRIRSIPMRRRINNREQV